MPLDQKTSERLKKRLPRGFLKRVQAELAAKNHSVTNSMVSMVLNGDRDDDKVFKALVTVAEKYEATQQKHRLLARGKMRLTRQSLPKN